MVGKFWVLCVVLVMAAGIILVFARSSYAAVIAPPGSGGSPPSSPMDCSNPLFKTQCVCNHPLKQCMQGRCVSALEPKLQSDAFDPTKGAGSAIIDGIFSAVNSIMMGITETFYTNVIRNPSYSNAVNAVIMLYIVVYGIMIMFGVARVSSGEVVKRLAKIGLVWSLMDPDIGWTFFNAYIGEPVIGALNELISEFTAAGTSGGIHAVCAANSLGVLPPGCDSAGNLNSISMDMLKGSITLVFSTRFAVALMALATVSPGFSWLFTLLIIWAVINFILMMIGAIVTYVRAIVSLSFLFALAPIFFTFMLFDRSKNIFMGWVNSVLAHFLQPVLLFAFLGFYSIMLTNALMNILFSADYCWLPFESMGSVQLYQWIPVNLTHDMNWAVNGTKNQQWIGEPPVLFLDILYFLFLTHFAKLFPRLTQDLSHKMVGALGPDILQGEMVGKWFANHIPGAQGRGPKAIIADTIGGVRDKIGKARFNSQVKRKGINTGSKV